MGEIATNSYRRKLNILIYKRTERYKKIVKKERKGEKQIQRRREKERERGGYIYIYRKRENEAKKRMIHKYTDG